jgi:RNA polymerase-binding transcription factor DksA
MNSKKQHIQSLLERRKKILQQNKKFQDVFILLYDQEIFDYDDTAELKQHESLFASVIALGEKEIQQIEASLTEIYSDWRDFID